jgi:ligand-binding sensor domain-containing protein
VASDGTVLIGAQRGLFRRDGDNLVPIGTDRNPGTIYAFHAASGGTLLVGAEGGLFRRDGDNLVPIGQKLSGVSKFYVARDGTLLIAAAGGLFRLAQHPWAEANVRSANRNDVNRAVPIDASLRFRAQCH